MELKHAETTGPLIDLFFYVYKILGYGFLERVYGKAMVVAAPRYGLQILPEVSIRVNFEGKVIGKYEADLIVNDSVIVELKMCKTIVREHEAQLLNYLRATKYEVGLLLNFGPTARYKRLVFENTRKATRTWTEAVCVKSEKR